MSRPSQFSSVSSAGPSPPRLLIVGAFPEPASLERYVGGALAERLRNRGWQALVASRRRTRLRRLTHMLWVVWRERSKYDLGIVEVYSGLAFVWAEFVCSALRFLQKPFVLALHGGALPEFARSQPGRIRSFLRHAVSVTCPSGYLLEGMKAYCTAIQVVPNPIDVHLYPFVERQLPRPHLVWLRAFHEIYNPCLAPRIIANLVKIVPHIRLEMAGPDQGDMSLQRTRALAATLGVVDQIRFLGPLPKKEVPLTLGRADIFINTSNLDNTPVSVIEAMACGLCVISTDAGGIPYLVQNEREGLLVQRNDANAMASAICRLMNEDGLAQQLSRKARLNALKYDWSEILPLWERLLTNARLGRSDAPQSPMAANAI